MQKVKLEELCEIKSSKRIYQNEYVESGVAFYRGKEISELSRGDTPQIDLYISREQFEELKNKFGVPKKGDLLITSVGTIGNTWVSDGREFYYKDGNITQIIDNENINTNYISYLFKSNIVKRQYQCSGTAQSALTIEKLNNIIVPMTTLNEQQKIVKILDKAQELIDKRKEQIEACDELIKSLFYHMFGDPVKNDKGWIRKKCKDVTSKIGSGATPKGGNSSYKKTGISLIRSMNVHNNKFIYKDLAHISNEQAAKLGNVEIEYKDILLNITGASVARSCIVPANILPARVNQHVSIIRCKFEIIQPIFLSYLFTNDSYQKLLWGIATSGGATREAITKQQEEELKIPVPPLQLQNEFAQKVEKIEQQKQLLEQSLTELENNFNSLMQRAFKGELF